MNTCFDIYILMKKVIILRKVRVIMKTFAPTFFDYFSLSLSKKKICDNEAVVCSQSFLRSSRSHIFFKKGVLKNFANLTGKHVCIQNRLQDRCFPVKFVKSFFNRTPPVATSETKHLYASAVDLLDIRIENLDWYKYGNSKMKQEE